MPLPKVMPVPEDRSVNDPAVLLEAKQVLSIFNNISGKSKTTVTPDVKTEMKKYATFHGWDTIKWSGNQLFLKANIQHNKGDR